MNNFKFSISLKSYEVYAFFSAPKRRFIFYSSFSLRLAKNLKQKHFLKRWSTCLVYIIFLKMYNIFFYWCNDPLNMGLFFSFTFCGNITSGRVIWDCKTILGFKKLTLKKSRVVWQSLESCCVCQQTVPSCQIQCHVFLCYIVLNVIMVMIKMIVI